jgi:hypothetical protein
LALGIGFEWGIIGGLIPGVVKLIFCFLPSGSTGFKGILVTVLGAGAGTFFYYYWFPLSSQRFFFGEGLVTLDLLALNRFYEELALCNFNYLSTSCFLELKKSSNLLVTGSGFCWICLTSSFITVYWEIWLITVFGEGICSCIDGFGANWWENESGLTFWGIFILI